MNADWPTSWQGNTDIQCGNDGHFMAVLAIEGQPGPVHAGNFQLILARWDNTWPEFRTVINKLVLSYGRAIPDWSTVRSVYIDIPEKAMADDSDWSIGVVFSGEETLWSLPFRGWTACPGRAQAIY